MKYLLLTIISAVLLVRAEAESPTPIDSLRINELQASNRHGLLDDEGNSSDWVELHNTGSKVLRLGGYRLAKSEAPADGWQLPNIAIAPGGFHVIWMSGLDRVTLSPEALRTSVATLPFESTLIPSNAKWKYLAPANKGEVPTDWTRLDFDDSTFELGQAGFGFGDEDDATELPVGTTLVLLRHKFRVDELPMSESIVLEVDFDDGFVAYLNGIRVAEVNAAKGEIQLDSLATNGREAGVADRFDLSAHASLLHRGNNVLAIAGLNSSRGSSDMSLKAGLGFLPTTLHASFRLLKEGGQLQLIGPEGRVMDSVLYDQQASDQSYGRAQTAEADWGYFLTPTPGAANDGPQQTAPLKSKLRFSPKPGFHDADVEVQITVNASSEVDIRYTQDGSEPVAKSTRVDGPVRLDKTGLFRAAAFVGRERLGEIESATYIVGRRPTLPVMSISMKPGDFYEVHMRSSATGRGSERASHLELFNTKGNRKVATGFGLRLHGGAGRRGDFKTKKSYRTYFRDVYGLPKVKYNIIPTADVKDFDKLVLRANANDRPPGGAYIRDQLMRDLHKDMGGLISNGTWYLLYVNGVNYGVYNVVERMDEEFMASHTGKGEFDIMKTGRTLLSGTRDGWDELEEFISSNDFSRPENYEMLKARVDIEDFTSYMIVNLWGQNYDWPHNNWYAARRRPDGKWHFMCWDAEWGIRGGPYKSDTDAYAFIDSGGAYGFALQRKMFAALLGNRDYREYYQSEVRRHLRGALSKENVLRRIRQQRDLIAAEVENTYRLRNYNIDNWRRKIKEVEEFASIGGAFFQKCTDEYFAYRNNPNSNLGLARLQNQAGYQHIVRRSSEGKWQELIAAPDEDKWTIRSLPVSPPPAGRPALYALSKDERRIVYRVTNGHLYEYSSDSNASLDGKWNAYNLTLGLPKAASDPSVVVANGKPHVFYVDEKGRVHELWYDGLWRHYPLPALPRAEGGAVASLNGSTLHVIYRSMYGVSYEQSLDLRAATKDRRQWITKGGVHRLPATGQPFGLTVNGRRNAVFLAASDWPRRAPFVFDWNERKRVPGYRTYQGKRNTLVYATDIGQRFKDLLSIEGTTDQAAGTFHLFSGSANAKHYLAFRDVEGTIREYVLQGETWEMTKPTELANAPNAIGDPIGWIDGKVGTRHYIYLGDGASVHQLTFDGNWTHRNLSM